MKDIQTPIRKLFYSNIATGLGYRCYENGAVPDNAVTPYVIISSITSQEDSNKSDFGNVAQTLIDIVTSYPRTQYAGSEEVDEMAGYILGLINSKSKFPITGSLQIVTTKVLQDQKLVDFTNTRVIYRRLIRFEQLIMEV